MIAIPVFNVPGLQAKIPGTPLEKKPLTSAFPGDPEGSMNERTANFITNEILTEADYTIEHHGGNLEETTLNQIIIIRTSTNDLYKSPLMIVRCFETEYVRGTMKNQIRDLPEKDHGLTITALKMKIPCLIPEVGSFGGISSETEQVKESDIK